MIFLADGGRTLIQFLIHLLTISILLHSPATSQPPPPSIPTNPYTYSPKVKPRVALFIVIGISSFSVITFLFILLLHCRNRSRSRPPPSPALPSILRRTVGGLHPAFIEALPTFDYASIEASRLGKEALECAICLAEFRGGETLRLIPKCDHAFHARCVDVWLESRATCPVCRSHLAPSLDDCMRALLLGPIGGDEGVEYRNDDVAIEFGAEVGGVTLTRSRSDGSASGRGRWFGFFGRSRSTGHVEESHCLEDVERFTLRLPEGVRSQIISGSRTGFGSGRLGIQAS